MELSVVIPTYNESQRIGKTLETIEEYFKNRGMVGEIIVVDDASNDATCQKVEEKMKKYKNISLLRLEKNYYKGWPVKKGILKASGKYVMYTDADLATPIEEAGKLKKAIDGGADLAIGSRAHPDGIDMRRTQPLYRRVLGKMFSKIKNILIADIEDSQCGFKMYKREVAKDLVSRQKIKNIIFEVEILYLAQKLGFKIAQVPIQWQHSGETRMRVSVSNAVDTLASLFKIWLWHHNEKKVDI